MKSTLIKNNKLGARFPWRLRGLSQKRESAVQFGGTSFIPTVSVYGTQLVGHALLHVFISTHLHKESVLDTVIHFSDEESKALNIHTDGQWPNQNSRAHLVGLTQRTHQPGAGR